MKTVSIYTAQLPFLHAETLLWFKDVKRTTQKDDTFVSFPRWNRKLTGSVCLSWSCVLYYSSSRRNQTIQEVPVHPKEQKGHCLF